MHFQTIDSFIIAVNNLHATPSLVLFIQGLDIWMRFHKIESLIRGVNNLHVPLEPILF